jgi:hypothetical protein
VKEKVGERSNRRKEFSDKVLKSAFRSTREDDK